MATQFGTSADGGYFIIDSDGSDGDTFDVYRKTQTPSETLMSVGPDEGFVFGDFGAQLNWLDQTFFFYDGDWDFRFTGDFIIKHGGTTKIQFDFSANTTILSDNDWVIRHSGSANADINIRANDDLVLVYGDLIGAATPEFRIVKNTAKVFEIDENGDTSVFGSLDVTKSISSSFSINAGLSMQCKGNLLINKGSGSVPPSYLILVDISGTKHYLWVDDTGDLRINPNSPPTFVNEGTLGTVVGTQT